MFQVIGGDDVKYIKQKWEKEGKFSLQLDEWEDILKNTVKCTASVSWREFVWKNLIQFFRVTAQGEGTLHTSCWRKCGTGRAGHFYVFWECPKLSRFW